jgi:hypothetical protein
MDIRDYYQNLFNSSNQVINESLHKEDELAKIHEFVDDLLKWLRILQPRPEANVLEHVAAELQLSAFSLVSGLYRQAFTSLRLSLELSLGVVFFSANRLELAEWMGGNYDLVWSQLNHSENGVFSKRYAKAFFPQLSNDVENYQIIASTVYRELSEFVHGNIGTWNLSQQKYISFNQELFNQYMDRFSRVSKVMCFALCLRFLKDIDRLALESLETHLVEKMGYISEIRKLIGGPV